MVNNKVFKLKPQTNKLSSNVQQSSAGAVSHKSMDMTMTVKKQDYSTYINKLNTNILSRMLVNSRNYKKNISNSTLGIQSTNVAVETAVETALETVQSTVSVSEAADSLTGEFSKIVLWPILYP